MSDGERRQIAGAAARLGLSLSGFMRQAALQASAVVERKAAVKAELPAVAAESSELVVVAVQRRPVLANPGRLSFSVRRLVGGEEEERWHYVDGEPVRRLSIVPDVIRQCLIL